MRIAPFGRWFGLAMLLAVATWSPAAEPIVIKAVDGLQFDVKQFAVKPGEKITLTFENADTTDMAHNLVITIPGGRETVVAAALELGSEAEKRGYVPKVPEVLFAIPALHPPEKRSLTFTAPHASGIYPYVCTLPGHGAVMFGAMHVGVPLTPEAPVEPADGDTPVLPHDHAAMAHGLASPTAPHAYPLTRPFFYRMFMPDAGPAAIAVALPGNLNYCWDAGQCRFRYVWAGDCVDNIAYWKGNGNGMAKVLGPVSYRAPAGQPLRLSPERDPETRFKGFHVVKGGPEFSYTLDGIAVTEAITATANGAGLLFTFTVDTEQALTYRVDPSASAAFSSPVGAFVKGVLAIPAKAGHSFTILFTPPTVARDPGAKP